MATQSLVAQRGPLLLHGVVGPSLGGGSMSRKQTGMQAGFLLSKTSTTVKQRRTMVRAMNPQKAGTKETGGQQTSG